MCRTNAWPESRGAGRALVLSILSFVLLLSGPLSFTYAGELSKVRAMPYDRSTVRDVDAEDLWVDADGGDDDNDGSSITSALRTIQRAADLAEPGTTVHILPGIYRETIRPAMSGGVGEPILYVAENGPGTVMVRGSEPSSSVAWTQLTYNSIGLPAGVDPSDVYYANLSGWGLDAAPRFVVQLDGGGNVVARLPLAREPDWQVSTEWKYHEYWWAADGGWGVAGCYPPTDPNPKDCDLSWRSRTQLTDRTNDSEPSDIEPGNLTTVGNLTGATLVALDARQGHNVYRRTISAHDIGSGRVTVSEATGSTHSLGWGSKYYVEGKPNLLDNPGEWWYDGSSGRLYLWPLTPHNPAELNIEISRRDNGFNLQDRSYTTLDGLTIEFFNENAVYHRNFESQKAYENGIRNCVLRYANRGVWVHHAVLASRPAGNITDGFTLEASEIAHMDTHGILIDSWWDNNAAANSYVRSGVVNTIIRDNEFHHLGFRSDEDEAIGSRFYYADKLRFEGNHIHDVAHIGVHFASSVIQSPKTYGFSPGEIKTGGILISDNVFEKTCQLATDCGALKIWGNPPDNHVFRDVLITGNTFRDTFGWAYVSEKRDLWTYGSVEGMGGFGLYVDMASGMHVYRNIAYNNAFNGFRLGGVWRDGDMIYYNNIAANSLEGFSLADMEYDTHSSVNTQLTNNIIVNNEAFGILIADLDGVYANISFDHNLYYGNGWAGDFSGLGAMAILRGPAPNEYYPTLADIRAKTAWEDHGVAGDPRFWDYDLADHDRHDGSWPDFHITATSINVLDQGTSSLPSSLATLVTFFGIDDPRLGSAFDIGPYEGGGYTVMATPRVQAVDPGGVARYTLYLYPPDLPYSVSLTASSPSPDLILELEPETLSLAAQATLTVRDTHTGSSLIPGLLHTIAITGTGGGFDQVTKVTLMVGGVHLYLPVVGRGWLG